MRYGSKSLGLLSGCFLVPFFVGASFAAAPGAPPLIVAAEQGDQVAVILLLNDDVDPNITTGDGSTALFWAAHNNNIEIARALLANGADVDHVNSFGTTPLYEAALNADGQLIELLLEAGANPNATLLSGETPLMGATDRGRLEAVSTLLTGGADPNIRESKFGQTALMWAAVEKYSAITKLLVDNGANVSTRTNSDFSVLMFAAQQGDVESGRALLEAGADANELLTDGNVTPLLIAAAGRHEGFAGLLLEHGADPNVLDSNGHSPLHHAAWIRESAGIVELLLDHGADPNVRLVETGPEERQVDVDLRQATYTDTGLSMNGATPFLMASEVKSLRAMRALLDAGADPTITTVLGTDALLLSAGGGTDFARPRTAQEREDAIEAVKMLVDIGFDVNGTGEFEWTPVHAASFQGLDSVIEYLVDSGADLNMMDQYGQTPLSIAYGIITVEAERAYEQSPKSYRGDTAELLVAMGALSIEQSGVNVFTFKSVDSTAGN